MSSNAISDAERAMAAGELNRAEQLCKFVLREEVDNLGAMLLLGVVNVKQGKFDAAVAPLRRVSNEEESNAQAPMWLSRCLRKLGQPTEALEQAKRAVDRDPSLPAAQHQLGLCYLEVQQFEPSVACFRRAIESDPNAATLHHGLGLALRGIGRNSEAIQALRRAAELTPTSLQTLGSLFEALMDESDSAGAVDCARAMLRLQPLGYDPNLRLARALAKDNRREEAAGQLEAIRKIAPKDGNVAFACGTILQSLGELEEAELEFRRSIELMPIQGFAYSALAYNRKIQESDRPLVDQMARIAEDSRLSAIQRSNLQYGIGKSMEDLGEYGQAMEHFDEANRLTYLLKFGDRSFDKSLYADRVASAIRAADLNLAKTLAPAGSESRAPIFVIGMLRSGTTLIDQILSSHPKVGSVGEQGFWLQNRSSATAEDGVGIDPAKLEQLCNAYLDRLTRIAPNKERVVDKMPDNYLEVPLLHMAFPNAKIVHCVRNPVDTCISIYTTINRLAVDWGHRKETIVFAYSQYQRLMAHWRELLPEGSILDVQYEELVTNTMDTTERLLAFCGLEWDDACLHPEQNRRAVSTPSAWQVRQPVYSTSIGRWQNYEPWLGEFSALLGR